MHTVTGLHHVTAIAGPAQENLDFYAGVLGMRLVKKSVNQDDPGTYHLFYADAEGHPGTDLTFFPWSHLAPSRDGHGLSTEVSLAVPPGSLAFWAERLAHYGVTAAPVEQRFGMRVLPLTDPHGLRVALVENACGGVAAVHAVGRQSGRAGAPDSRTRERAAARTRAGADDVVPDRRARLRAAGHRGRLASLRRGRRPVGRVRRRAGDAVDAPRARGASAASTTSPGAWTTTPISWTSGNGSMRPADGRRR